MTRVAWNTGSWPMAEDARRETVRGDDLRERAPPSRRPMAKAPVPAGVPQRIRMPIQSWDSGPNPGAGWWRRIPARLWMTLIVLTAPVRALVIVLDGLVAASVLGVLGVAWAWWTHRISDDQVAQVLGEIGARGLSILSKAGIM